MAKKADAQQTFTQVVTDIRKRKFAPIYLLSGEEPYFLDQIAELLLNTVVAEDERDFDQQVFYGNDADLDAVISTARRFPVMADHQLVMLKEAQSMANAKTRLNKLAAYTGHPVASTVFVIVYKGEPLSGTSALVKEAVKNGAVIFQSEKVRDYNLRSVIAAHCKEARISIDDKSMDMLAASIGTDLSRLFSEIEKLVIASGERRITPESIERNIGISKDFNSFELISAIAARNYTKAQQIVAYFEQNPNANPTQRTLPLIFNFFSNLMLAYYSPDRSDRGLMKQLNVNSVYRLRDIKKAMPLYTARKAMDIIHSLREFDCRSKGIGSAQKEFPLFRELIYKIFTL